MKKITLASLAALTLAFGTMGPAMARDYDRDHGYRYCKHGHCDRDYGRREYREHRRWRFFDWRYDRRHHDRDYYRYRNHRRYDRD